VTTVRGARRPENPPTSGIIAMEDAHTSGLYTKRSLVITRGEGATVWDSEGRAYVDCVGGQGSANLGHGNTAVAAALADQARTLASCTELFYNDRRAELYGVLAGILPRSLERVFLCNSGTEAAGGRRDDARLPREDHGRALGDLGSRIP